MSPGSMNLQNMTCIWKNQLWFHQKTQGGAILLLLYLNRHLQAKISHLSGMTAAKTLAEYLSTKSQSLSGREGRAGLRNRGAGWFHREVPRVLRPAGSAHAGSGPAYLGHDFRLSRKSISLFEFLFRGNKVRKTICSELPGTRHHPLSERPRRSQTTDDSSSQQTPADRGSGSRPANLLQNWMGT